MELRNLLQRAGVEPLSPCAEGIEIASVSDDSRQCGPGALFVAIAGGKADGHAFLDQVAKAGSPAALVQRDAEVTPKGMVVVRVDNTRRALARIAQTLAGDPTKDMKLFGVTGTNGKTTVAYLMESILKAAGLKTGLVSTIEYRWDGGREEASHTTPSPVRLAATFANMAGDGVEAAVMEVSSHALDQYRVDGLHFCAGAFTNLTQDHLDYHQTMDAYGLAKRRLFSEVLADSGGAAALNYDDPAGRQFFAASRAARNYRFSYVDKDAEIRLVYVVFARSGMNLRLSIEGEMRNFFSPMHGLFNVQNCLTSIALAHAGGIPLEAVRQGLAAMHGAPGRFEFIECGQPFPVIVDYAHTPDALLQLLLNARGYTRRRLIAIFGCGGDRDRSKRAPMGRAAARLGHFVIVANDNPRTEDPEAIADAIVAGIESVRSPGLIVERELDRRKAIRRAIALAEPGDAVVIAGKGHEDYQILGTMKTHFDDREEVRLALAEKK